MGFDGSNLRRLTDDPSDDFFPSFSPDGRHIAFASERDGNLEIYVMGFDGSNPRRLTDHPTRHRTFLPRWSPDGRHIAFVSERDGNLEIYVMASDGSNPRRLTDRSDTASDRSPSLVAGWPPHRLCVRARRQLGDIRDGLRWQQSTPADPPHGIGRLPLIFARWSLHRF